MMTVRSALGRLTAGLIAAAILTAPGAAMAQAEATPPATPATPATPPADGDKKPDDKPATPSDQQEKLVYVKLATSKGDIVLELNNEKAPISTKNFLAYVEKGHYDGTIFHRVIDNFMIQGGGFTQDLKQKSTDAPIKNEWKNGLKNERGTIAMARTNVIDSATSQFFINVKNNDFLDQARDGAAYAVFGKVVSGMDVVDKIKSVKTTNKGGMGDVPVEPVVITQATKLTEAQAKEMKSASPSTAAPAPAEKK